MSFVYPYVFLFFLVPLLVFIYLIMTNKSKLDRIFEDDLLERLKVEKGFMSKKVREFIFFTALILMLVALARPVIYKGEREAKIAGASFFVALDISGSMRSKDIYPNRLIFAKQKIIELLKDAPADEVALGAFSKQAFIITPLSYDKATLIEMIQGVDTSYINQSSTDFSSIVELSDEIFKKDTKKNLVLFTDGGDVSDVNALVSLAKEKDVTISIVLIGTQKGAPVLDSRGEIYRDKDGSMIFSYANKDIFALAQKTGGMAVEASYSKSDVDAVLNHMREGEKSAKSIILKDQRELFYYPLGLAILLLLISFSSLPRRRL
ncbi:MAG: VWA domain-containing protein [Campylobacterales bacterium]|nr:VWA domain-containing protein [Campylobacterales bacterium]